MFAGVVKILTGFGESMASVFKRGKKWYITYKDENGNWKQVPGFVDKALSLKQAETLEYEATRRRLGHVNTVTEGPPLADHLAAYEIHLRQRSDGYSVQTLSRIKAFGFRSVGELIDGRASERVGRYLSGLEGKSTNRNHYLKALQIFCRWLKRFRGLPHSPICDIRPETVTDAAERRALTDKEIDKLLRHLHGDNHLLSAEQRYYLYATALETGFRAAELASLTPSSFQLSDRVVLLPASRTKNKAAARQPLLDPSYIKAMAQWLKGKKPDEKLWPNTWYKRAAEMIDIDLGADSIDFHSLRVTYVTRLVLAGYNPKVVQTLARHSTMELTMRVYAKLTEGDVFKATKLHNICTKSIVRRRPPPSGRLTLRRA
jgi:integrase